MAFLLVMLGFAFLYLAIDVGMTTAAHSGQLTTALVVATGTQQMTCAVMCLCTGVIVWAIHSMSER